jgi:hypothetical protein
LNSQNLAEKHYSRADVQREIADFCTERWVAAHCVNENGELVFRRYFRGKPLKVGSVGDFQELLRKLNFQVRSLYASANKYRSVKHRRGSFHPFECNPLHSHMGRGQPT